MSELITRKQFITAGREQLKAGFFDRYFLQFGTALSRSEMCGEFSPEELLASTCPHLNDLALQRWDDLARRAYSLFDHEAMRAAGEICGLSTMVCTLKAQARQQIETLRKRGYTRPEGYPLNR
jgi:hypothetical protein